MQIGPETITRFIDYRGGMGYENQIMPLRQDHPLTINLFNGGIIEVVDVLEDWEDDDERCYTVRVTTSTDDYVFAIWWSSAMFFVDLGRAIGDRGKSLVWAKEAAGIK